MSTPVQPEWTTADPTAGVFIGAQSLKKAEPTDQPIQDDWAESESQLVAVDGWVRESPPWLLSAVLHMTALILLAVWLTGVSRETPLALDADFSEELGEQLLEEDLQLETPTELQVENQALSLQPLPPVLEPLSMPSPADFSPVGLVAASDKSAKVVGIELSGREPGMRKVLLKAYGGTATTESAVMAGLEWLARNQKSSGAWSLRGPYSDGSQTENEEAATAMALLAFQGRGFTHLSDPRHDFSQRVALGWKRLLRSQDNDGCFYRKGSMNHRFYTHAQCTIALCELYGMTRDEAFREPAQRAVDYLVATQAREGGWRYQPGTGSDLSVTGWVVMALQSARMAGIDVPSLTLLQVNEFLDIVARNQGSEYAYMAREGARLPMTAEGLLCRQYLGWQQDDPRLKRGVKKLLSSPPRWGSGRNVYYLYYATQVCHHMEGDAWNQWNKKLRQLLPEKQQKRGRERGSWSPKGDVHGGQGGRLYVTCLSIYSLEVYYRHLPIYRNGLQDEL